MEKCKLCGGEAEQSPYKINNSGCIQYDPYVSCKECNNSTSVNYRDYPCHGNDGWEQASSQWHNALADAVSRWNALNKIQESESGIGLKAISTALNSPNKKALIEAIINDDYDVGDVNIINDQCDLDGPVERFVNGNRLVSFELIKK